MTNILAEAKKYIKTGWNVIPIRGDGSKAPALQKGEVEQYRQRYATPEELQKWFQNTTNWIGIVTGKLSGISVADVDSLKKSQFTSPVITLSPNGKHYYYKYEESLKNWVKPTDGEWDVRTEGGYVCAPPSPGYRWVNPWFDPNSLPLFPSRLIPKQEAKAERKQPGYIADLLTNLKPGENRHSSFASIIGRLHYDRYDSDTIRLFLASHAEACGLGVLELEKQIAYITSRYSNDGKQSVVVVDESDSLSDFLSDVKPIEWLVDGVIGKGTIGFCAGLPETLKTWLMADLAIETARGGKWLGRFQTNPGKVLFIDQERYKTEVQRRFNLLLKQKGLSVKDLEGQLVIKSQTTTRLDLDESFNAFKKRLEEIRPSLIIIDSFATAHTREENNRKDIQTVLERVKQIRAEFGCTILFIDHENKSVFDKEDAGALPNAFKMAGSVGKPAAAETVFTVRKVTENEVVLYHTKSTISPTIEPVKVTISDTSSGVLLSC